MAYRRPKDITEQELAEWQQQYRDADIPRDMLHKMTVHFTADPSYIQPDEAEAFLAVCWMRRELDRTGTKERESQEVRGSFMQQYPYLGGDPWPLAFAVIEQHRDGTWDRPGEELLAKMNKKHLFRLTGKHAPPPKGHILKMFHELNVGSIDPEAGDGGGIPIPHAIWVNHKGEVSVAALAMVGPEAPRDTYRAIYKIIQDEKPRELVFGLDRFARPDQGTTRSSVLSVQYWTGRAWKFGIIEYDTSPVVDADEINWGNEHWIANLKKEFLSFFQGSNIKVDEEPYPPRENIMPSADDFGKVYSLLQRGLDIQAIAYLERQGISSEESEQMVALLKRQK